MFKKNENSAFSDEAVDDILASKSRPVTFDDFIGQKDIKENLKVFIESAQKQSKTLDHALLYGPPGLGKTTLANIVSRSLGANLHTTAGPILSKTGDLAAILTHIKAGDVLFIDEIHRMPISVEEMLYSAMEDFRLDIIVGDGPMARSIKIDVMPFTLIGATTRIGLMSSPLRSRFGILLSMQFYDIEDLGNIIKNFLTREGFTASTETFLHIATLSRRTPRIALRLTRRIMDFAVVENSNNITMNIVQKAIQRMKIDSLGLEKDDIQYLSFIANKCGGGPVGIETIASALSEEKDSIEDTIEPFLIAEGFILKTPRGRKLTDKAFTHLGLLQENKTETLEF